MRLLLEDGRVNPKTILKKRSSKPFHINAEILELLLKDPRTEVPSPPNFLAKLCECGEYEAVKIALADTRVDFDTDLAAQMVKQAISSQVVECLKVLFDDVRISSIEKCKSYFELAVWSQDLQLVEFVYNWLGMKPEDFPDSVIVESACSGAVGVFAFLLTQGFRVYDKVIKSASSRGHVGIVELCVKHPSGNVDENYALDSALVKACSKGHTEVAKYLLQNTKASPTHGDSLALFGACGCGHKDVVDLLLEDGRSQVSAANYRVLTVYVFFNLVALTKV